MINLVCQHTNISGIYEGVLLLPRRRANKAFAVFLFAIHRQKAEAAISNKLRQRVVFDTGISKHRKDPAPCSNKNSPFIPISQVYLSKLTPPQSDRRRLRRRLRSSRKSSVERARAIKRARARDQARVRRARSRARGHDVHALQVWSPLSFLHV